MHINNTSKHVIVTYQHEKKIYNLRKLEQHYLNTKTNQHPVKQIIHNKSSYVLTRDEETALSYGLQQHIPPSLNKTDTDAEFDFIKDSSKTYQVFQKKVY